MWRSPGHFLLTARYYCQPPILIPCSPHVSHLLHRPPPPFYCHPKSVQPLPSSPRLLALPTLYDIPSSYIFVLLLFPLILLLPLLHLLLQGEDRHVTTLSKGEYFGELALVTQKPRAATVAASTPTVALAELRVEAFERLLGKLTSGHWLS